MKYTLQQKLKCNEDIARIKESIPDYAGAYIDSVAAKTDSSFRTGRAYAYELLLFFDYIRNVKNNPAPTPEYLDSLKPMDIDAYMNRLGSYIQTDENGDKKIRSMSASSKARNLAAVRGLYKYLLKNRLVSNNPAALADTPKSKEKDVVYMNGSQVETVFEKLKNTDIGRKRKQFAKRNQLRDTAMITLMLYTGIRVSECVGIDLSDISFAERAVKVRRKGGREQTVYFNDEVKDALRDYIDNERTTPEYDKDALFVTRRNERMSVRSAENIVRKYTDGVSVSKITPHKLRSTYATTLYENTSDAYLVKDALGHSTLGVVQKYINASDKNRKLASTLIDYNEKEDNK